MIQIFEVGPRDGLQNLPHLVSSEDKIRLICALRDAGLENIEITSFVHPKAVPNMADATTICDAFEDKSGFSVLVPNQKGLTRAIESGMNKFNIFFSPMDSFNVANYGLKKEKILENYRKALKDIPKSDIRVYISESFEANDHELSVAVQEGLELGDKIVLCDTKGTAMPYSIQQGVVITKQFTDSISLHLHHGRYMMENLARGYKMGIREFDSSIGGLGGCPFVAGSGANLATEDLVAWCEDKGIECGVKSEDLKEASKIAHKIKNPTLIASAKNKYNETLSKFKAVWF